MYLNQVTIIGNLTRDPEQKALPSGVAVVNFSVATNRTWKDKEGQKKEAVEFHNVVVFGKTAENVAVYMKKGNLILIQGRLQTRSWEADGVKKYITEIIAENVVFGRKPASNEPQQQETQTQDVDGSSNYPDEEINPEDIPF